MSRLDRPRRRWLLVLPGSIWTSLAYRAPCLVYPSDGTWVHHYPGTKIPHVSLGRAAPPAVFTAEAREVFLHDYAPRAGDTVFDVGAGIGAETLLFSRLVGPHGRVVSFEAHPRTYARLAQLCRVNRLANVVPVHVAAADVDGEITISDSESHLLNTVVGSGAWGIRVLARRIDTVARELNVHRIDLLKINIEGAERLAIQGLGGIIENVRHVCISCHDFLADDGGDEEMRTRAVVREYLAQHGFHITSRQDADDPWLRDYVYGTRRPSA